MKQNMRQDGMTQEQGNQTQTLNDNSWDKNNRPAEMDELDFEDEEPSSKAGDAPEPADVQHYRAAERARAAGLTGAALPDEDSTDDDLTPENLLAEDGARSSREPGSEEPAEWELTEKYDVGGGHGLDEAELARRDPLDKTRGEETNELLDSLSGTSENYVVAEDDAEEDEETRTTG